MTALADVLRERGWSKTRLAAESGVSAKTIARWLSGQATPSDRTVQHVAKALCEPVGRLISRSPKTPLDAALSVNGWTTDRLARQVGLAPDTISYLRAGVHQPNPQTARLIADALGIRITDLFPDRPIPTRTPFAAAIADSGFSQRELARQAGVGMTTIESWATGAATPRADKAHAVARVLGKPVDELFTTTRRHDLPLVPTPAKTLTAEQVLAVDATGDPKWGQRAACATGHDRELWFPETGDHAAKAREVCATCPVVGDCRDAFLSARVVGVARQEMDRGIWAGLHGSKLREAARNHGITREREADRHLQPGTAAARNDGRPARPTRDRPADTPGTRLSRILEDQDLTNRTVAQAAGVPESTLGNWVRGERVPTATAAAKVAAVLNVPVADLFDRVDPDLKRTIDRASPTLRQALEERGLSLHAAAKQAGLANRTAYRWLEGSRTPTADAAEKLANVVGVPATTLFPNLHTSDYRVLPPGHRLRADDVALPTPDGAATRAQQIDLDLEAVQRPVRERGAGRGLAASL